MAEGAGEYEGGEEAGEHHFALPIGVRGMRVGRPSGGNWEDRVVEWAGYLERGYLETKREEAQERVRVGGPGTEGEEGQGGVRVGGLGTRGGEGQEGVRVGGQEVERKEGREGGRGVYGEGAIGGAVGLEVWAAEVAGLAGRAGLLEREGEPGPCPAEDWVVEPGASEGGDPGASPMEEKVMGALEKGGPVGEKATGALEEGGPVVSPMGEGVSRALEEEDLACQLDDRMV